MKITFKHKHKRETDGIFPLGELVRNLSETCQKLTLASAGQTNQKLVRKTLETGFSTGL